MVHTLNHTSSQIHYFFLIISGWFSLHRTHIQTVLDSVWAVSIKTVICVLIDHMMYSWVEFHKEFALDFNGNHLFHKASIHCVYKIPRPLQNLLHDQNVVWDSSKE